MTQKHDSTDLVAMVLEVAFGGLGAIFGVGWLYVGRLGTALAVFLGFLLLVLLVELPLIFFTWGCLICVFYPLNVSLAIISGIRVRDYVRNTGARGNVINVLLVVIFLISIFICGLVLFFSIGSEVIKQLPPIPTPAPLLK